MQSSAGVHRCSPGPQDCAIRPGQTGGKKWRARPPARGTRLIATTAVSRAQLGYALKSELRIELAFQKWNCRFATDRRGLVEGASAGLQSCARRVCAAGRVFLSRVLRLNPRSRALELATPSIDLRARERTHCSGSGRGALGLFSFSSPSFGHVLCLTCFVCREEWPQSTNW